MCGQVCLKSIKLINIGRGVFCCSSRQLHVLIQIPVLAAYINKNVLEFQIVWGMNIQVIYDGTSSSLIRRQMTVTCQPWAMGKLPVKHWDAEQMFLGGCMPEQRRGWRGRKSISSFHSKKRQATRELWCSAFLGLSTTSRESHVATLVLVCVCWRWWNH